MRKKYRGSMDIFYKMDDQLLSSDRKIKNIFDFYLDNYHKNKILLIFEKNNKTQKVTFKQFVNNCYLYAKNYFPLLKDIEKGSFVALKLTNSPIWLYSFWALLIIGYKPLLINSLIDNEATNKLISESDAKAIICNDSSSYNVKKINVPDNLDESLPLEINWENEIAFCTSGTTGQSRIFVYDGEALIYQIDAAHDMPLDTNDIMYVGNKLRLIVTIPFAHIFGFVALFLWYSFFGCTLVFPNSLNPNDIVSAIKKYKCSHIYTVPLFWNTVAKKFNNTFEKLPAKQQKLVRKMMEYNNEEITSSEAGITRFNSFQNIIKNKVLGKQIVYCISGGGSLSAKTLKTINGLGYPLYNGYGMTETGITSVELIYSSKQRNKGSIGRALKRVEYKTLNNELLIRSPYLHIATLQNGKRYDSLKDEEGFFHTGDIAKIDEKGFVYIKGKIKDVIINSDGENVYPDEIEAKCTTLQNVDELSIISIKDNEKEIITLILHLDNEITTEIIKNLNKQINEINDSLTISNKIQKVFISKKSLPINSSMKIQKFKLIEDFNKNKSDYIEINNALSDDKSSEENEQIKNIINKVVSSFSKVLNINKKDITPNSHIIIDLNGDSFSYMELLNEIEEQFEMTFPSELIGKMNTPKEFAIQILKIKK